MLDAHVEESPLRRLDALLLVVLVLARIRIDTLAEGVALPLRQNDVARHPWLGNLLPEDAATLLAQQQLVDPIGLLLIAGALAALLGYLLVHEFAQVEALRHRLKLGFLCLIVAFTVILPSLKLVLLRQGSGPASYSHDGGVIQTEATIDFLLAGRNPYVEDYLDTPMAEWGINEFRTALYHYPYLPWTFLFSAPFKLLSQGLWGWYDQRLVYLLLFAVTLALLLTLPIGRRSRLMLAMLVGLNPLMGSDLIYGQNDSFVLAWLVGSIWLWMRGQRAGAGRGWTWASAAAFGLACASKPTAWFFAPFYLFLLAADGRPDFWRRPWQAVGRVLPLGWPALAVFLAIVGPYLAWDPAALVDDVWAWSNGTSPTAYQIWGWGASNLVLAAGWVDSRFAYWPFWLPQVLVCLPVLVLLLVHQIRQNTMARALWSYGLFLFLFFFFSRFFNENYLGYILALLALGTFLSCERQETVLVADGG